MEGEEKNQDVSETSKVDTTYPQTPVSEPSGVAEESVTKESKPSASSENIDSEGIGGASSSTIKKSSSDSNDPNSHDGAKNVETKLESGKAGSSDVDSTDQTTIMEIATPLVEPEIRIHDKPSEDDNEGSANSKTETETEHVTAVEEHTDDSNSSISSSVNKGEQERPTANKPFSEAPIQSESSRLSSEEGEKSNEKSDSQVASDKSKENEEKGLESPSASTVRDPGVLSEELRASSKSPDCVSLDISKGPSSANEEGNIVADVVQDSATKDVPVASSIESSLNSENVKVDSKDSPLSSAKSPDLMKGNGEDISSTQFGEIREISSESNEDLTSTVTDDLDTAKESSADATSEEKDINQIEGMEAASAEASGSPVVADSDKVEKGITGGRTVTNLPDLHDSDKLDDSATSVLEPSKNITEELKTPEVDKSATSVLEPDSKKVTEELKIPEEDNSATSVLEPDSKKGTEELKTPQVNHVNVESDVIPSSASADVDHENAEEAMDVSSQNDEDDPFFSCRDKEKDHDSPMEVDEAAMDPESEMVVDEPSGNDENSSHSDMPGESHKSNESSDKDPESEMVVDEASGNDESSSLSDMPVKSHKSNESCDKSQVELHKKDSASLTSTSPVEKIPTASDADLESPENIETNSLFESPDAADKETECTANQDAMGAEKPAASVENSIDEETITADKPCTEGDDEVCIVPDTAPRVLTDKEKAEAFEKAKSSADTIEKISVKTLGKSEKCVVPSIQADTEKEKLKDSSKLDDEEKTEVEKSDKESDGSKRKFNIQLVSTASLVSRKETPEKDQEDVIDISDVPDDIQTDSSEEEKCAECGKVVKCKYQLKQKGVYLCEDECYTRYRKTSGSGSSSAVTAQAVNRVFSHKCGQCSKTIEIPSETAMTWETMDFCSEDCLEKYQKNFGACCANCKGAVQSASLGKYCVRFGYDMKQFCSALCLEDFKKGLKVCSYCQKDISGGAEGFLAPVGDKGQFKDFCTQECMEKYDQMSNNSAPPEESHECAVCNDIKPVKVEILMHSEVQKLCSKPCFAAYKFVNKINTDQCDMCKKHFDVNRLENFSVFYDDAPHSFCCKTCMNVYILAKRKIVPCTWCKVKKYNFDMIKKTTLNGQILMWCSLHCLNLYQVSVSAAGTLKHIKCDSCNTTAQAQYHLTMSDATLRSFCTYTCVQSFQGKFPNSPITVSGKDKAPHPLGLPRRITPKRTSGPAAPVGISGGEKDSSSSSMPVISSVTSLAPANGLPASNTPSSSTPGSTQGTKSSGTETTKTVFKQQFIIRPPIHPEMNNCAVQVKPLSSTKAVSCRPHTCTVGTQTDDSIMKPVLIPVPVPIYIPAPMHMYTSPYPVPVPIVLPIPVPIFIPTTRNSAKGIFKEIKRIQEKFPSDPFEAELLMMAEMVAGEKKADNTDTESEDGGNGAADDNDANDTGNVAEPEFSPENVEANNSFGDDVLQIALKMASELDEPAVDFEAAVTPTTIAQTLPTQTSQPTGQNNESEEDEDSPQKTRSGRKRTVRSAPRSSSVSAKRGRKSISPDHTNITSTSDSNVPAMAELVEKPDANMCLKFTFGVNAWKWWVNHKNAELEKAGGTPRKMKPFKTDLLQLTADELNYSLCLFVKEVKKPNGQEYAPDTIYYLCLGIQQYLIENGRVENIFSDPYYEKFTDCLDEVAKQFSNLYSDAQYLVTRIEEEHLWESKQLGAHSPYVLLSTLMFFNTKHFNLTTVEEHMQLSFTHIMKHWKRNPNATGGPKAPGSRNVLLRFYPPQSALAANSKKKKVYEQQENEDNPLRCPVKLYEFYLSKCPESVKTRNDVFYLLPERSCVPDSPVWYSTMALGYDQLQKMLHRIKMVKEINML